VSTPTPALEPAAARATGLFYLGVALTGLLGFLTIRPRLFDADDPAATLSRLLAHENLARAGIAVELALVVTQVLAALWFYRLFRAADRFSAVSIAVFGTVNAVVILGSAAFLATALDVALDPLGDNLSQLMYLIAENLWGAGNVFFGLWLIPMGVAALRSGWAPRPLGRLLVVGGVLYVLKAFGGYLFPAAGPFIEVLVVPATIGEFWMIGRLLLRGLRVRAGSPIAVSG
jgi:hypothetical protein